MIRLRRVTVTLLNLGFIPLLTTGCLGGLGTAPERGVLSQEFEVDVSSQRTRMATRNAELGHAGTVELIADSIMAATRDPVVARNALSWKANAIPVIQRAFHHADPLLSFVDGWILSEQMLDYYATGAGRDAFGEYQPMAVRGLEAVTRRIDERVEEVLDSAGYQRVSSFVRNWSDAYPLDNDLFVREPVGQVAAETLDNVQLGGLAAVGRMEDLALDAQQMVQSYLAYTPKVLLWQAQLIATEMVDTTVVGPLLDQVDQLQVLAAATRLMDDLPSVVAAERRATVADVEALADSVLATLLVMASTERATVLDQVARLVREERSGFSDDVATTLITTVEAGGDEAIEVLDHVLWRIAQLAVLLVLLFSVVQFFLFRAFLRRSSDPSAPSRA
ncbi:MAG: hypothetical protein P8188_13920 [Gemmatimonadota bacterium]